MPPPRAPRPRRHARAEDAMQLALEIGLEPPPDPHSPSPGGLPQHKRAPVSPDAGSSTARESTPEVAEQGPNVLESSHSEAEPPENDVEPMQFDPDPFAEIPGFARSVSAAREFVLLPGSLRSRLDLRELTRFLASLPTVTKDWDGAPEIDDGGIRLRGPEGGAWIYPEANRVRVVTDGTVEGPVGEDLVALCRWLEGRAGMRLYPAGETCGAGVDRSLDPWETFT
jgi:hypothetical protein